MEQFENLTDSETIQQNNCDTFRTTDFTKKTDKKRINYITLCIIKVIVALGLFGVLFVAVGVFFYLYSKNEIKQFIPKIIEWFFSALSGIGVLYTCKQLAKWFKN